uniref:FAD dependent oxidoreductase domain-containing protein n=1 Tax=Proboscia inermis TaxID=420281 RepID=A0A7S0CIY4_9STRA|mmetsp:Transcript_51012/g.51407  ORF Transcript_51012/g.51407 Transcript_51012/m.51407 type:complete len:370 (+) Transcript_51012:75-1184(+)
MLYQKIVIAGGGIIGNSIAYYLAKEHQTKCTIIDCAGIAPAASGKAGGFLARDWSDSNLLGELQRHSFDLHAEIASDLGEDIVEYRRLTCAMVAIDGIIREKPTGKKLQGVEWADLGVKGSQSMGGEDTIAQVHPKKLCDALFGYAQRTVGTELIRGRIVNAVMEDGSVAGVTLEDGSVVDADAVVVACGPWTHEAQSWFGSELEASADANSMEMYGTKYHSILVPSPRVLNQAVFFQGAGDPEVYPRPDGDAYITGFPESPVVVTDRPGKEQLIPEAISRLVAATKVVSSELGGIEPHTEQCCYLPTTVNGLPVIGKIPGVKKGGFVASGHSCWGILNGPATGQAVADLLIKGNASKIDLAPFDPRNR